MKRVILPLISFLLISGVASAQTLKTTKKHKKVLVKKVAKDKPASTSQSAVPDNRKNYMYPDGQKATPTGHDAAPVNADTYEALDKNSSKKKKSER
jgi:hypothetical protein